MKRSLMILASIMAVGIVGCSHSPNSAQRKLAGLLDAGLIGPNGEVILFYKSGDKIIVQQCDDLTILNKREDCQIKAGTQVAQVSVSDFKSRLKSALALPGDYDSATKDKIDLYKKETPTSAADILKQRADAQTQIDKAVAFGAAYGNENVDQEKLKSYQSKIASTEKLAGAIKDINDLVDKLVDNVIASPIVTNFVYSTNKSSFEFNILKSYIKTQGLVGAQFVTVRSGSFTMGSQVNDKDRWKDEIPHPVKISKDFEIQTTEVTQGQYFLAMGYNPSRFKNKENCSGDYAEINGTSLCFSHPVENVSFDDVQNFIKVLNSRNDGYSYSLPTEAQWEYAARGGRQEAYSFGDDERQLDQYGWYYKNSLNGTQAVGQKTANAYGLYDVHGNVWEWVSDWYGDYPSTSVVDPTGPSAGRARVLRGGSWYFGAGGLRSAFRFFDFPVYRFSVVGFRLLRTPRNP